MTDIRIFLKREFENISRFEAVLYFVSIFLVVFVCIYLKDSKIATLSAFFGISYTVLAGNGKLYCYFFGLLSSLLYSYLAFKNGFFGNFALNLFYYFPCQLIGFFLWKKHLKKNSLEIIKTKLKTKNRIFIYAGALTLSLITGLILKPVGKLPFCDAICLVFSIFAMVLTVKRCIEQWHFWIVVNFVSMIMWIFAYLKGQNCIATVIMWLVYLVLGFYFLKKWKENIRN